MLTSWFRRAPLAERLALAVGLLSLCWFQIDTCNVRFANVDDIECDQVTKTGQILDYIGSMARTQSRFFQLWNLGLVECLNHIGSNFWFAFHRTVLLGTEFALGSWLLARLCNGACYGWLFWVVGLGTLQLPPGFYPVLSYPPIAFGLIALLTAALALDHGLVEGRRSLLLWSGVCFFASMLFHDTFTIYVLLFPLVLQARRRDHVRRSWSALAPVAVAFGCYMAVYLGYRWSTFADHTYDGTTASYAFGPGLKAWIRYTFSVVPGFELWFRRDEPEMGAPIFHSVSTVVDIVRHELTWGGVGRAILTTLAAALLLKDPHRSLTGRLTLKLAAAASLPGLLACVPIAFSVKYQAWAVQRQIPYAYSFFACFFGWAAVSALLISGAGSRPHARHSVATPLAIALIFYAAFCAQITNARVLRHLGTAYNRPIAAAVSTPVQK